MAGKRPEIHLTQTNDVGRLLQTITGMPVHGYMDFSRSLKIAQLSLKHRQNKKQKQRIVIFVGSPIEGLEDRECVKLGKQLRKNDIAIDVINFGHPENLPFLTAVVDNCNKNENSHMIEISYGHNIADTIITSSIVAFDAGGDVQMPSAEGGAGVEGGAPAAPGGAQPFSEYGGIDPNLDPELAMAIRISLEEAKNADSDPNAEGGDASRPEAEAPTGDVAMESQDKPAEAIPEQNAEMEEDEDDYEEALEEAKRLSMVGGEANEGAAQEADKVEEDLEGVINEEFLGELMQDLGVPMTEDAIKGCLEDDEKKDDKDKDKKDEDK